MTEISTSGLEAEPTLLDEAQVDIARHLAEEFAEVASEHTVAEIVDETIGALKAKGYISRDALLVGSHFKFANLRPHPEAPITAESFCRLDEVAAEVNDKLGIDNRDRSYAHSSSMRGDPVITVSRNAVDNGLRIIGATVWSEDGQWRLQLRNDGGTVHDPWQAAGTRTNYDRSGDPSETVWASEQDVIELAELVAQRSDQNRFVKKEKQFRLHL